MCVITSSLRTVRPKMYQKHLWFCGKLGGSCWMRLLPSSRCFLPATCTGTPLDKVMTGTRPWDLFSNARSCVIGSHLLTGWSQCEEPKTFPQARSLYNNCSTTSKRSTPTSIQLLAQCPEKPLLQRPDYPAHSWPPLLWRTILRV